MVRSDQGFKRRKTVLGFCLGAGGRLPYHREEMKIGVIGRYRH